MLDGLELSELQRLRDLALLFLHEKSLEPVGTVELSPYQRVSIAVQACLPLLNLGLDWLDGWVSVIIYPDEFVPEREWVDEAGVVHTVAEPLTGEAWLHGPLILSWPDVAAGGRRDGYNVVIHELAHKLDGLTGDTNGMPPLHRGMDPAAWTAAFAEAFAALEGSTLEEEPLLFDDYAAESPAEFFAVACELFFELPEELVVAYPAVYHQLRLFFRQDPAARLPSPGG